MYRIVISDGYETTIIRDNGDVIGVAATKNSAISIMLELNQIRGNFRSGRDKVLDEVLQLPQRREQPNGSMYIYVNDVKALRQAGSP